MELERQAKLEEKTKAENESKEKAELSAEKIRQKRNKTFGVTVYGLVAAGTLGGAAMGWAAS
jgi:hypothetical protein